MRWRATPNRHEVNLLTGIRHRLRFWRDHRWLPDHSSDYLDDQLDDRGRERADRHLAECPECDTLVDGLRTIVAALGSIGAEPSDAATSAVLSSLQPQLVELPSEGT